MIGKCFKFNGSDILRRKHVRSGSEVLILNGEEKGKSNPKCARVCAGTTGKLFSLISFTTQGASKRLPFAIH